MPGHHVWGRFLKSILMCVIILLILLGVLAFSLFTGYRPDLLRGSTRENHCLFYRAVRGLILSVCSFLFSACNSDPATSQLLQS